MFSSWVRRKSLKKVNKKDQFLVPEGTLSPVMLLSLIGLMVMIGIFVVHHSLAAQRPLAPAAQGQR